MKNLKLYGSDFYSYMKMLLSGNTFRILISKRLLMRPLIPMWILLFFVMLVPNSTFFGMVGLPCLGLYAVFLFGKYPYWEACHVKKLPFVLWNVLFLIGMKLLTIPIFHLLEVIAKWTFYM